MADTIYRVPPELFDAVMAAARAAYPPANRYGVFAMEIGRPTVRGRVQPYHGLVVHVRRKLAAPPHPVPPVWIEHGGREYEVVPDVQASGVEPRPQASPPIQFSGVRVSAAIASASAGRFHESGGIAAILQDDAGEPRWFVTAGHLFDSRDGVDGWNVWAAGSGTRPQVRVGRLVVNLLDRAAPGLRFDAALVELTADGQELLSDIGIHALRAPEAGQRAQPILSTSNTWGAHAEIELFPNTVYMRGDTRGTFAVHDVVKASRVLTNPGDSGCPLCDTRTDDYAVIASTVGVLQMSSLFEPVVRSVSAFERLLSTDLHPWSP